MTGEADTQDQTLRAELSAELERLRTCDPWSALGISAGADEAQVRGAFLRLTKAYHPNRFARSSHEVARLANDVYLRIKSAYDELVEAADRRRAQDRRASSGREAPGGAAPPAEQGEVFSEAVVTSEIDTGRSSAVDLRARQRAARHRAVKKRAERTGRSSSVYPAARMTTAVEDEARREQEVEAARELLQRGEFAAARLEFHRLAIADPQRKELRVYMHLAWGHQHEADGDAANAAAEYNRALKLDPDFAPASRAIKNLNKKTKGWGLFSKLFRK